MNDKHAEAQLVALVSQKKNIQEAINKKQEGINSIQSDINKLSERLVNIDEQMTKIKSIAIKRSEMDAKRNGDDIDNIEDVEESDAAVTTGALDASSQSSGGPSGWKGGDWRVRPKIGSTVMRHLRKKKKKVYENFIDDLWDKIDEGV